MNCALVCVTLKKDTPGSNKNKPTTNKAVIGKANLLCRLCVTQTVPLETLEDYKLNVVSIQTHARPCVRKSTQAT